MQIERKGTGPWAQVNQSGAVVTIAFGEDEKTFDCTALQQDAQLVIDIVMGFDGHLAEGIANGSEYVANVIIPPRRYADVPQGGCALDLPMPLNEEPLPEGVDPQSITPAPVAASAVGDDFEPYGGGVPLAGVETVPVPFDEDEMEAVRIVLWTVNEIQTHEEMM